MKNFGAKLVKAVVKDVRGEYIKDLKDRHGVVPEAVLMQVKGAVSKCEAKRVVKSWRKSVESIAA